MSTIVTRIGKGSALTYVEGDANFTNLNTDKAELIDLASNANAKGASLVGIEDSNNNFTATTVEGALEEHVEKAIDAHDASAISNVPAGTVAATTVQAAINELDTDKVPESDFSPFGKTLVDDTDRSALKTTIGLQVDGVTALRTLIPGTEEAIYLTYRSTLGDGGGGVFYWDSSDLSTEVTADTQSGIYVAPNSDLTGANGAWVRVHNGTFHVPWFGTNTTPGTTDMTTPIQAAIDLVKALALAGAGSTAGGGWVDIPAGIYAITRLIRRTGVSIRGAGSRSTFFVALADSDTVPFGMFELEPGPVVGSHLVGFRADAGATVGNPTPVNATQWAMYSHAQWDAGYTQGGLWFCNHVDVEFRNFNFGLWSRGGYTTAHSLRPNQFLQFDNCRIFVRSGGEAVRLTGQHGQIEFRGGDYSGFSGQTATRCLTVDWDPDPSTTADDASGHGESTSDTAGAGNAVRSGDNVSFTAGSSLQRADTAAYIRNTPSVNFEKCWLESIGKGFDIEINGACHVAGCYLANVGNGLYLTTPSAGNGWLVSPTSNASLNWGTGNVIAGLTDNLIDPTANLTSGADRVNMSTFNYSTLGKTNVTTPPVFNIDISGQINSKGHKIIWLGPYVADKSVGLDTIDSELAPNETLTLYAFTEAVTLVSGGNIRLPSGISALTIGNRTHCVLRRIWGYLGVEWHVESYSDEYANALPVAGEYYAAGTRIWDPSPTAGASPGWICTTAGLAGTTAVFKAMAALAV